jgi:hypothetical protein
LSVNRQTKLKYVCFILVWADSLEQRPAFELNWLQVSAVTKLSEIDEAESNEFESEMTSLFGFIT